MENSDGGGDGIQYRNKCVAYNQLYLVDNLPTPPVIREHLDLNCPTVGDTYCKARATKSTIHRSIVTDLQAPPYMLCVISSHFPHVMIICFIISLDFNFRQILSNYNH
jgi:hypothetical protein